jgi:hypothetical protein
LGQQLAAGQQCLAESSCFFWPATTAERPEQQSVRRLIHTANVSHLFNHCGRAESARHLSLFANNKLAEVSVLCEQSSILSATVTGDLQIHKDMQATVTGNLQIHKDMQATVTGNLQIHKDMQATVTGDLQIVTDSKQL